LLASFDLVREPWIPVRDGDGTREIGLEECLTRARQFERIEDASPLVTAALHRFLLAVLSRALRGPRSLAEATDWFRDGLPLERVRAYLAAHHDRFDLFHPTAPFYQVADFGLDQSQRSWTILAPELNSDNNKVLFDHTVTARPEPLRPALAARLLIANQMYALSAGKSIFCHTATAPLATAVTVLVQGDTLHETLCLNLSLTDTARLERDTAAWEEAPLTVTRLKNCELARGSPLGVAHRATWPARAIRLHPEELDGEPVIFWISYASGLRCDDPHEVRDPLVAYRAGKENTIYPWGFREGRALWRDFHSLLPAPSGSGTGQGVAALEYAGRLSVEVADGDEAAARAVEVAALGQANDQAKVELWRHEHYRLPAALLTQPGGQVLVEGCLKQADTAGDALNLAARALARRLLTSGERQPHKDDVSRLVRSLPHGEVYWSRLEGEFARWLAALGSDAAARPTPHRRRWAETVIDAARRAWEQTVLAAGEDAQALRAVYASERLLFKGLAALRDKGGT
jgi:CRISPR system Cascade subunit CasA